MVTRSPMMTTGRVGGCSWGKVVSSKRGMAAARARAGTEVETERKLKMVQTSPSCAFDL